MQILLLVVLQLAAIATISVASTDRSNDIFSEPQSLLLFGGELGDLLIVTPTGKLVVPHPPGSIVENSFPLPALAPAGDQVAASFRLPDDAGSAVCHPSWPVSGPHKREIYRSVLGVYSLRDKKWKLYGDFCFVGSAAFSPDGNEVAFKATRRSDDPRFLLSPYPDMLLILDLRTGQLKAVPDTASVIGNRQLSWSPDGQFLAVSQSSSSGKAAGIIVLIRIGSWVKKEIAVGVDPSWSPKGDWIAYLADWNRTCMMVHPDGTGSKTALDLQRRSGGWLFYNGINWSADEDRLLLNEEQFDGPSSEVTMLNLTNGQVTTKSKRGVAVLGWAAAMAGAPGPTDPRWYTERRLLDEVHDPFLVRLSGHPQTEAASIQLSRQVPRNR